jgi:hypothetical protein
MKNIIGVKLNDKKSKMEILCHFKGERLNGGVEGKLSCGLYLDIDDPKSTTLLNFFYTNIIRLLWKQRQHYKKSDI